MAEPFYPFVENPSSGDPGPQDGVRTGDAAAEGLTVGYPARVAVYDDAAAAPRVVVVEPTDVRSYLEEVTVTVNRLAHEQGGSIPFTVIRECVENLIHAYFTAPTVSILDGGDTIRFSDQGPGIADKHLALEYGTSSATEEMKRYIRGVGSGLPYASQYMEDKGGSLTIEDNIQGGCVVTISLVGDGGEAPQAFPQAQGQPGQAPWGQQAPWPQQGAPQAYPAQPQQPWPAPGYPYPAYQGQPHTQPAYAQPAYQQPYGYPVAPQPAGSWPAQQPVPAPLALNEAQTTALSFLVGQGSGGATDLVRACGKSAPTWSRALQHLAELGLAHKNGQKYLPTEAGVDWARRQAPPTA